MLAGFAATSLFVGEAAMFERVAYAQSTTADTAAQALVLFQRGAELYRDGKFQDAAQLFEQAYALKHEPILLRNLARAYEGIEGRAAAQKALDAYTEFLHIDPKASDAAAVEQRIKALRERIDKEVALEQQRDDERRRAERAEQSRREADEAARKAARKKPSPVPWVVFGVGALGAGTGLVFGALANGQHAAARDERNATLAETEQSRAQTYAVVANVLLVTGGVIAVAGLIWGIVDLRVNRSDHSNVRVALGNGITLSGGF